MKQIKRIFTLTLLLITGLASVTKAQATSITIAAAADLKPAMDSIIEAYKLQDPTADIQVTYGSSGKFFEQISNDAPFDIFFSADIDYPNKLKDKNFTISDIKTYGYGQLVLWSKKIDPNIKKMNSLLDTNIVKIAIANPAHAPYGARAVESLKFYNLYDKLQSKFVLGENISQTAQFVTTGAADIGLVALSLALSPNMQKEGGKYYIIPDNSHSPLQQAYVILKHAQGNATAVKFYTFISSATAINIFTKYGFSQSAK
ncbi:MAG TPA: molybdate ABC transporter substrate-binding protein [Ferruginibacter sp.]|jgi:molybdate transport system substrate-binding protein|nr:molybdate ABC transporter substrate-binding protein [Ferruginibacter sp.]